MSNRKTCQQIGIFLVPKLAISSGSFCFVILGKVTTELLTHTSALAVVSQAVSTQQQHDYPVVQYQSQLPTLTRSHHATATLAVPTPRPRRGKSELNSSCRHTIVHTAQHSTAQHSSEHAAGALHCRFALLHLHLSLGLV